MTPLPPDEEPRGPDREEESADSPGGERPPGYTSDDLFDGVPPDQMGVSDGDGETGETGEEDVPDLDPQFAEALREASGGSGDTAEYSVPDVEDDEGSDAEAESSDASAAGPVAEDVPPADSPEEASSTPPAVEADEEEGSAEEAESEEGGEDEGPDAEVESEEEGSDAEEESDPDITAVRPAIPGHGREEARAAFAQAAETGRPWAPARPPLNGDLEAAPRRPRLWLRFLLGAFVIVASFASATSAVGLLRLADIVDDIKPIPNIADKLAKVEGGEAQTFLILGSDKRASAAEGERGLSDTTMLLRVDPDGQFIALLNIPRDLKVEIPGVGTDKFNAAYAYGGPQLTLRTLKLLTAGTGLQINHLVNVDFLGFAQAVNAIDCVYIDVDRRYYHSNVGLPAELQYDEINVQPGYQRLCGEDALDYARYRHTDTDLVRAARQQDFLREARQRVPASELFKELTGEGDLIEIFTTHTSSDIQDSGAMIDVLKLLIEARNARIREVHFPAVLGPSYVTASRPAIQDAINQLLGFESSGGPRGSLEDADPSANAAGDTGNGAGQGGRSKRRMEQAKAPPTPDKNSDGLVDVSSSMRDFAARAARKVGADLTVFYPRRLPSAASITEDYKLQNPRVYHVRDGGRNTHEAYKMVFDLSLPDGLHYFGVQGIRGWEDPPILKNPSETRTIDGRDYLIHLDGDRVRLIGWREGGNSYWVSNSLLRTLTNDQMLGIARSVGEIEPAPKKKPGKKKKGKG